MDDWPFVSEPRLVPYGTVALPARGLLVLAPHPDDETFGCGGTIAAACDAGLPVTVVVATDGAAGGDAAVREREVHQAVQTLSAGRPLVLELWRHADRGLQPDAALGRRIRALVEQQAPGWVLAPSPFEVHPDHRALCVAAIQAAAHADARLGFYEIGQPLLATDFVDITAWMPRKRAAMGCYASQLAVQRYDEQVESLNRLRAYTLGPQVLHAEAFWFPSAARSCFDVLADLQQRMAQRLGLTPPP